MSTQTPIYIHIGKEKVNFSVTPNQNNKIYLLHYPVILS